MIHWFSNPWTWLTAWRDTRRSRLKLFLFASSIVSGVAVIVCISSLSLLLSREITKESKSFLGADLLVSEKFLFSKKLLDISDSISSNNTVQVSREISFNSMAFLPKKNRSRLVSVSAVSPGYPFYGNILETPEGVYQNLKKSRSILIDKSIASQYDIGVSDTVLLGRSTFTVAGIIENMPGQGYIRNLIFPSVYIDIDDAKLTGLLQYGSVASYRTYFKTQQDEITDTLISHFQKSLPRPTYRIVTLKERASQTSAPLQTLYKFFTIIGLIAMILGIIGISSSVSVYLASKKKSIETLKLLGSSPNQIFAIYTIQCIGIGLIGSIVGAIAGVIFYYFVGSLVFSTSISTNQSIPIFPLVIIMSMLLSTVLTIIFSLPKLISIRNIRPLLALQNTYSSKKIYSKIALLVAAIVCSIAFYMFVRWYLFPSTPRKDAYSLFFTLGLIFAVLAFIFISKLLLFLLKKVSLSFLPYPICQGILNLHRPGNQTVALVVTFGLSIFLLMTAYLLQENIALDFKNIEKGNEANMFLIDVQPDQKKPMDEILSKLDLPILQSIPIVTMRIHAIKGKYISELAKDTVIPDAYNWEYRATYRDTLFLNESILEGVFPSTQKKDDLIGISISEFFSSRLNCTVGDTIIFNVHGILLTSLVESIRKIDFRRVQANFSIVFPERTLEKAPMFFIYASSTSTEEKSATSKTEITKAFPNVTIFDMRSILQVFKGILEKGLSMLQLITFSCLLAGFALLASSLINSQQKRIQENSLLKIIGATRVVLGKISTTEFFFIAQISSFLGTLFAIGAAYAISEFVFQIEFRLSWESIGWISFIMSTSITTLVTVLSNLTISRSFEKPTLEILRQEN